MIRTTSAAVGGFAWQLGAVLLLAYALVLFAGNAPPLYVIGGLAAVLFGLLFLQRPDVGLLVLLVVRASTDATLGAFVEALSRPGRLLALLFNPNTVLILILIVAGGLFLMRQGLPFLRLPGGQIFTLFLLTGLIGVLRSDSILVALNEWLPVVSALVVYALAANLFRTPQRIQRVLDILAVSFVLPALLGFVQMATAQGRTLSLGAVRVMRIDGTFAHPNSFAVYLAIMLSVFLCQGLAQQGRRKWVAMAIVLVSALLLVGTYTRSLWAGALVILAIIALFRQRWLLVIGPIVVAAVYFAVPAIGARLANPLSSGSGASHLEIWQRLIDEWVLITAQTGGAITVAMDRLSGLGPGSFGPLISPIYVILPHNDYLRILVEYGVFGLVLYVLLYVALIRAAYRSWRRSSGPMAAVALGFLAMIGAYLVASVTDNLFAMTVNQVYFWTLAGLVVAVGEMRDAAVDVRSPAATAEPIRSAGLKAGV